MPRADRLYEKAIRTKSGWRLQELLRLYEGFGFVVKEGRKHIVVSHPLHRNLVTTITRKRTLARGYIDEAVKIIEALQGLEEKGERDGD